MTGLIGPATRTTPIRILDFDIENRPLSYLGMDFTSGEVTAIAASWVGEKKVHCWLVEFDEHQESLQEALQGFRKLYDEADMVTGHYIRRHDLPVLNGAYLEQGLPLLDEKMTSDTKMDLKRSRYISLSQESLGMMYRLEHAKHHMSQPEWRAGNRLTAEGRKYTAKRVIDDVNMHKALRERLIVAGALKPAKMWRP